MIRTRALGLYAVWQARDLLPRLLAPLGIFAIVAGLPVLALVSERGMAVVRTPGASQDFVLLQYHNVMPLALALGAIVLMSGGASLDRERQHTRFLFSRPVAPWLLYLQQFAISIVLFAFAVAIIPLLYSWAIVDVPVLDVMRTAALFALAYGTLALLCGALWNRDGLAFIGLILVSQVLQAAERAEQLGTTLSAVAKALPPLAAAGAVRAAWFADRAADPADLRLVILYSLGMLVAALVVIHRRPLVR